MQFPGLGSARAVSLPCGCTLPRWPVPVEHLDTGLCLPDGSPLARLAAQESIGWELGAGWALGPLNSLSHEDVEAKGCVSQDHGAGGGDGGRLAQGSGAREQGFNMVLKAGGHMWCWGLHPIVRNATPMPTSSCGFSNALKGKHSHWDRPASLQL